MFDSPYTREFLRKTEFARKVLPVYHPLPAPPDDDEVAARGVYFKNGTLEMLQDLMEDSGLSGSEIIRRALSAYYEALTSPVRTASA